MSSIRTSTDDSYLASGYIEYNLEKTDSSKYILTLRNTLVSFLDRENGRIYFIEKNCYLELTNKSDLAILIREN
jgi:hypothetical protein